jgi:hypothetical protein
MRDVCFFITRFVGKAQNCVLEGIELAVEKEYRHSIISLYLSFLRLHRYVQKWIGWSRSAGTLVVGAFYIFEERSKINLKAPFLPPSLPFDYFTERMAYLSSNCSAATSAVHLSTS